MKSHVTRCVEIQAEKDRLFAFMHSAFQPELLPLLSPKKERICCFGDCDPLLRSPLDLGHQGPLDTVGPELRPRRGSERSLRSIQRPSGRKVKFLPGSALSSGSTKK